MEWTEFDLSELTDSQFTAFFFDRAVVTGVDSAYDLYHSEVDEIVVSNPAVMVAQLRSMCRGFAELEKNYSPEQLDQGLWALFGATGRCGQYLFDPEVDSTLRVDCFESMFVPFRDVVARHTGDIRDTFYWMWWDMILHDFDPMPNEYKCGYLVLTTDQNVMIETIFRTLSKILALGHHGCQLCALHGLGHLYHPLLGDLVRRFLGEHAAEFNDKDREWIEACGNSSIL